MIPPKKQAELVKLAQSAGAQPADNGFWKELEERMDLRTDKKKPGIVTGRNLKK
jgi:hypothetical protein